MEGTPPETTGSHYEQPYPPTTGSHEALDPEGQRAWIASVDRKLGTRTYAAAVLLVLALAAAIVALVIAVDARDNAATSDELDQVAGRLSELAAKANEAGEAQKSLDAISGRLDTVEDEVDGLSGAEGDAGKRLDAIESELEDLRQQVSGLESEPSTSSRGKGSGDRSSDGG